jgi:hypothetical protein
VGPAFFVDAVLQRMSRFAKPPAGGCRGFRNYSAGPWPLLRALSFDPDSERAFSQDFMILLKLLRCLASVLE